MNNMGIFSKQDKKNADTIFFPLSYLIIDSEKKT